MKSFAEFWTFYLKEHSSRRCRSLHFLGTSLAISSLVLFVIFRAKIFIFVALLFGYGLAWIGHFLFEKNKPATFRYPIYSIMGDWKMCWLAATGKLQQEFQKNQIKTRD